MNFLKIIKTITIISIFLLPLFFPIPTSADEIGTDRPPITIQNPLGEGATIETLIQRITNFLAWQLGPILAVLLFIVAGLMLITAGGNETKIANAKRMLLYIFIGYAVIIIADSLVLLIRNIFSE